MLQVPISRVLAQTITMKEAAFVKQNKARWEEFERIMSSDGSVSPDKLAELFIQITEDLSFSRTQYPDSRITNYLNSLASKVHLEIYKNKKESTNRFITFWTEEVPQLIYDSFPKMGYSLAIFVVSAIIGWVSAMNDDTFVRLILGDGYVNMTMEYIKEGKPTAVYSGESELNMFFYITLNNIMVSFYAFVTGIFFSVVTGFLLFRNGVMFGSFAALFQLHGQFEFAMPVVMLHGTIELSSIVIAGGAGLVLGNSILFPGTYSRMASFKMGALKGMKIVVSLVPMFVMAGFIESYITRFGFMHWSLKLIIIGLSAVLVIFYFIVYPIIVNKRNEKLKRN